MSDTVFFSFVLFLGSPWSIEPHSISVTEGVENSFSSSSKHLDEDLTKLFDEILLQVFPRNLDDVSKDTSTAGRLITWSDVNESKYLSMDSECVCFHRLCCIGYEILRQVFSNDPKYLTKEGPRTAEEPARQKDLNENHIAEKTDKEPSLFNRDLSDQLTTADTHTDLVSSCLDAHNEGLPCRQMLSFLQKNIVIATIAVASVLLVTVFVVFVLVTYLRRKQPRCPPANTTYNIFIMNGKGWWHKPEERLLRKFAGKQKHLKCNSCV
uniref:RIKEN cDNA 4933424G06 gene n=1 Tax=Cricetulus griseus TaxID=10029 RepID=A0A8C2MV94_CRIGR